MKDILGKKKKNNVLSGCKNTHILEIHNIHKYEWVVCILNVHGTI